MWLYLALSRAGSTARLQRGEMRTKIGIMPPRLGISHFFFVTLLSTATCAAWAQAQDESREDASEKNARYEIGIHAGDLLPNQIAGVTEIIGLGGVRAGIRMAPLTYAEAGLIAGNGSGVQWKNLHVDARMDIPVEN